MKSYRKVEDTRVEITLVVQPGEEHMRLDRFIQRHIARLSRTRVQEIIYNGVRDGDGKATKPAQRVRAFEIYRWCREVENEVLRDFDIPVVHEDEQVLALNKPGDLVVHPTARIWRNTVTAWLKEHKPGATIAHRLDRETSGVLMCGKGAFSAWLKERFRLSQVKKTYWAIVRGEPEFEVRDVDLPLLLDDRSPLKVKMRPDPQGLPSRTRLRVMQRLRGHALIECVPETGRQHQIRVHLWALGLPILGDKLYGVPEDIFREAADLGVSARVLAATGAARHMLHARQVEMCAPDGCAWTFSAPIHEDMATRLARLRADHLAA